MSFYLYAAPMQGHTDAPYRHYHAEVYGAADAYFSPFIRIERKDVRHKDIREIKSELNDNLLLIPQLIINGREELDFLLKKVTEAGYDTVDLNIGCPYPMQTNHGRGAALLADSDKLREVLEVTREHEEVSFSLKMRAGLADSDDWRRALPIINDARLSHVTFHPRVATQKYEGDLDFESFEEFLSISEHPVIFNGDITTPARIHELQEKYPKLAGVMCGRGLLARPSLFAEAKEGEWDTEKRKEKLIEFHDALFSYFEPQLCGEKQLLARMKAFWEFAEPQIGRKAWKLIQKATTLPKYTNALAQIP